MSVGEIFYLILGIALLACLLAPLIMIKCAKQDSNELKDIVVMQEGKTITAFELNNGMLSQNQLLEVKKMLLMVYNKNQVITMEKVTDRIVLRIEPKVLLKR